MRRIVAAVTVLLIGVSLPAEAQEGVFVTGPVSWSPSVVLSSFGYDSNVFLEAGDKALRDITGTLTPTVRALIATPRITFTSSGSADLVYFERYIEQRSLNYRYDGRAQFNVSLFQPYVGAEWTQVRDRQSVEFDTRAKRGTRTTTVGVGVLAFSRASLALAMSRGGSEYDRGQVSDGIDLAEQLNRSSEAMSLGFSIELTPLTTMTVSGSLSRDKYLMVDDKDQENQQVTVGVTFAPDAVLRGRASVGYSRLNVEDPAAIPFSGITTDVDLTYALFGTTQVNIRYSHATSTSIREAYLLQTSYGGEVRQAFLGPVDLVARANWQEVDYPGLASRDISSRFERLKAYAAGVVIELSGNSTIDITYEMANREAADSAQQFERRRIVTSVSLGF